MPLIQVSNGDGNFDTYVKFNAKAGRWYTKPSDGGEEFEIEKEEMTAVWDFANAKTGYFLFAEGMAPEKIYDPSLSQAAPKPDNPKAKRGVEIRLFFKELGVREFSTTSTFVLGQINDIYDQYEAQAGANEGKLPVVQYTGNKKETNKHGTNYAPLLEIVRWVPRPAALSEEKEEAKPEPKPEPKKAPASAAEDDAW